MTVRKTLSRSITLLVSLLLAVAVAASYISILSDREVSFICTLTASHSGKYQAVITYTDEKSELEDSWKDGDRTLKTEMELEAGVPFTLDLRRVLPRTVRIHTADIAVSSLDEGAENVTVVLSGLKVNLKDIGGLYLKDETAGRLVAEKCSDDTCASKIAGSFSLKLAGKTPAVLSVTSNLNLKVYRTNFAVLALLIIVTVGTGIFYKLIRYILHKKRENGVNIPDVVFIVAVVLTSFVPALMINTKSYAVEENENRVLDPYKPLFTEDGAHPINLTWTRDFESWFNDRFGGRRQLIRLQQQPIKRLQSIISMPRAGVCQTGNSWCFTMGEMSELNAGGYDGKLPSIDYISKIASGTDIPVYLLIFPFKTEIYPEKVLFSNAKSDSGRTFSSKVIEHLKAVAAPNVHVVDLTPAFKEDRLRHPNALSYLIDEHHATEYGGKVVMDYLNANVSEFKERNATLDIDRKYPPEQFQIGSGEFIDANAPDETGRAYYLNYRYGQTWGTVFGKENRKKATPRFKLQSYPFYSLTEGYLKDITYDHDLKCDANIHLHNKNAPQFKVYILGNSFIETLAKMVATGASDVYRRRYNSECGPKTLTPTGVLKQLEEIHPDAVLMTIYGETFEADLK